MQNGKMADKPLVEKIKIREQNLYGDNEEYKQKYLKLKEFMRGKWKGDCAECAAIANEVFNKTTLKMDCNSNQSIEKKE